MAPNRERKTWMDMLSVTRGAGDITKGCVTSQRSPKRRVMNRSLSKTWSDYIGYNLEIASRHHNHGCYLMKTMNLKVEKK